jgi:hypothetical protein
LRCASGAYALSRFRSSCGDAQRFGHKSRSGLSARRLTSDDVQAYHDGAESKPDTSSFDGALADHILGKASGFSSWVHYTITHRQKLKPKDLVGIPWIVALALQADGWTLRSDIIWSKKNPMPASVTDRPTTAHEYP